MARRSIDIYLQNVDRRGFIELKYKTDSLEVVVDWGGFKTENSSYGLNHLT